MGARLGSGYGSWGAALVEKAVGLVLVALVGQDAFEAGGGYELVAVAGQGLGAAAADAEEALGLDQADEVDEDSPYAPV